jgi:flagellar hook protein FlgE
MINTIYTALSGMTAYQKGLDAISNNVANLNTPGYKKQVPLFLDVVYLNSGGALPGFGDQGSRGGGVTVQQNVTSFNQGEFQSTGNPLDAAVDGAGFFVLQNGDNFYYTRAGQFEFDQNGNLADRASGALVAVRTADSAITNFNVESFRTYAPRATTSVMVTGNISRIGTPTYRLPTVVVYDSAGTSHTLSVLFFQDAADPLHWLVEIHDENDVVVGGGELAFNADGTPAELAAPLVATLTPDGLDAFDVTLNLGAAGTYSGITSQEGNLQSGLRVAKQDGVTLGTLNTAQFDDRGQLTLIYSNGEKLTPATLLLAKFDSSDALLSIGAGRYVATNATYPQLGTAQSGGLGRLVGGQIEMSNVDLTDQFTNLIIIQRGYQASSQMASVANEMAQQLLKMASGG